MLAWQERQALVGLPELEALAARYDEEAPAVAPRKGREPTP
jgi:hypothetical protein